MSAWARSTSRKARWHYCGAIYPTATAVGRVVAEKRGWLTSSQWSFQILQEGKLLMIRGGRLGEKQQIPLAITRRGEDYYVNSEGEPNV